MGLLPATGSATDLLAARYQMALSLGWHIVLAAFGVAFPLMILVLHRRGLRGDDDALRLARRWSKVAGVLFAIGAVSGTILSFEMGMLWPGLMGPFGDVIGLPFALEGISFFTEAIFLGIYLYGWDRLPGRVHSLMLVPVAIAGATGTFFIMAVNAWMNSPEGFELAAGEVTEVSPVDAMFTAALPHEYVHMYVAAFIVVGFVVAAVYAAGCCADGPTATTTWVSGCRWRSPRSPRSSNRPSAISPASASPISSPRSWPRWRGSGRPNAARIWSSVASTVRARASWAGCASRSMA